MYKYSIQQMLNIYLILYVKKKVDDVFVSRLRQDFINQLQF